MSSHRRLDTNVPGPLYVTSACIDCDTCRQLAPTVFFEVKGYSSVARQPETGLEQKQALHGLLACPTAAIVSEEKSGIAEAMADFPLLLDDGVYYCGYTSPKSFGGAGFYRKAKRQLACRCAALRAVLGSTIRGNGRHR